MMGSSINGNAADSDSVEQSNVGSNPISPAISVFNQVIFRSIV